MAKLRVVGQNTPDPDPVPPQRVTLIRPAIVSSAGSMSDPLTPPLGLGYLAAMLEKHGVDVTVIDAIAENPEQVISHAGYVFHGLTTDETLDRIDPESSIIGVTCMFTQDWPWARLLIKALRERFPKALIIAGGEHISALPEFCLRDCPELDVIARGEGEETIVDIARYARDVAKLRQVDGVAFIDDAGEYVETTPRKRISAVDEIPPPAWHLFPMEVYLSTRNAFGVYRGRSIGILATRGCPYECTFCSNPLMYGRSWVAREPDDVLDEIQGYIDDFDIQNVDFYDLTMVLKRQWILDFCQRIERRGMKFTWQLPSGTRSEVIDDEVSRALYRTGCRNVSYAPESGSLETLELIKKKVKLPRLQRSIKTALGNGIIVRVNLIIGFPHEDRRHIFDTLKLGWKLALAGVHDAGYYQFSPYPGTELFDELRDEGRIGALDDNYFRSLLNYKSFSVSADYCRNVGARELAAWQLLGMASFFGLSFAVRPWRFARLVKAVAKNESNTALEMRLGALVRRKKKGGPDSPVAAAAG